MNIQTCKNCGMHPNDDTGIQLRKYEREEILLNVRQALKGSSVTHMFDVLKATEEYLVNEGGGK